MPPDPSAVRVCLAPTLIMDEHHPLVWPPGMQRFTLFDFGHSKMIGLLAKEESGRSRFYQIGAGRHRYGIRRQSGGMASFLFILVLSRISERPKHFRSNSSMLPK